MQEMLRFRPRRTLCLLALFFSSSENSLLAPVFEQQAARSILAAERYFGLC
jgi:hypothetical protein